MPEGNRFSGTVDYIFAHWPRFAVLYGGIIVMMLVIGASLEMGWYGFVPLSLVVVLLLTGLFMGALWTGHLLYDVSGLRPHHILFEMGNLQPEDSFVYLDLGIRRRPVSLSRRLTRGRIMVVDIFSPQWAPGRALRRWRARWQHPPQDPRLTWLDGQINLLPLPDRSVTAVILCQITSEFWQHGDRLTLLREVHRILTPDGQLLFAEQCRTQTNFLFQGVSALQLPSKKYWRTFLNESGFRIRREQSLQGLITCFRAQKPTLAEARQLAFDLDV